MASRNTTLFVGGLDDQVTEDILFAAFIPFGPLKSVQVAKNFKDNATKGFGFVQFEAEDDAAAAVENMVRPGIQSRIPSMSLLIFSSVLVFFVFFGRCVGRRGVSCSGRRCTSTWPRCVACPLIVSSSKN
jgi:RNA recognition motif-containing protein